MMQGMSAITGEILSLCAGVAGALLTVGLVLAALQIQIGIAAGNSGVVAHVTEQIIAIIVCFIVAVSAKDIGAHVADLAQGAGGPGGFIVSVSNLGGLVVRMAILSAGAGLAFFISKEAVSAQIASLLGSPNTIATIFVRLGMVFISGVVTLLSLEIARLIVGSA